MKKLLFALLILFAGCTDPLDEFINSTGARICGQYVILGDSLNFDESAGPVSFNGDEQTYSISCDEVGVYLLGSGTPTRQSIIIDKLTFSANSNNRINSIDGQWRILTLQGKTFLDSLKSSPDSLLFTDSIRYLQQTQKMGNDVQQIVFDIQSDFEEPHTINPVSWKTEKGVISFNSDSKEQELIYVVSTKIEEF